MKILEINATIGIGSVGRIVVDLYNSFVEHNHTCKVAYGRGIIRGCVPEIDVVKIGNSTSVLQHVIMARLMDRDGFYSKRSTLTLIEEIDRYQPDIIHLHGNYGYYINIELLFNYLKKVNVTIINTLHSCWDFTGHCTYFDMVDCNKWKSGCYDCPQKKMYPQSYFVDASKENYEKKKELFTSVKNMVIVTPSHWLSSLVKESFLNKYPIKTLHNGINLEAFHPRPGSFKKNNGCINKKIILGVANGWDERKGLDTFIRLAYELPEEFQIVLIGLSNKQIRQLPSNIIGIARTNNILELAEMYTMSDVFLNPTLEDNFPTTNLEALACGIPVVTYKTGGSGESLTEETGIIVERGNYTELKQVIATKKWQTLKKEDCINRGSFFNKETQALKYLELLNMSDKKSQRNYSE